MIQFVVWLFPQDLWIQVRNTERLCPERLVAVTLNSLQKSISQSSSEEDVWRQETQKVPGQGWKTYWSTPRPSLWTQCPKFYHQIFTSLANLWHVFRWQTSGRWSLFGLIRDTKKPSIACLPQGEKWEQIALAGESLHLPRRGKQLAHITNPR